MAGPNEYHVTLIRSRHSIKTLGLRSVDGTWSWELLAIGIF